jgi:hypothetical protein
MKKNEAKNLGTLSSGDAKKTENYISEKNYLNIYNVFRLVQRKNVVVGCELAVGGVLIT